MNPMALMKIKGLLTSFSQNHPKIVPFFQAAGKTIDVDSIIEITVTTAEGKTICTNMKVKPEDVELFKSLKDISA